MKKLCERIRDNYYPSSDTTYLRDSVKAIVLNEKNEVALIHIKGVDMFGQRDHYELPGGGVEGSECYEDTFYREVLEELGFFSELACYLGTIEIEYNLLKRTDVCHFYVGYLKEKSIQSLEAYEKALFEEIVFVPIDTIEDFYQSHPTELVGSMIHRRDLLALKEALRWLQTNASS